MTKSAAIRNSHFWYSLRGGHLIPLLITHVFTLAVWSGVHQHSLNLKFLSLFKGQMASFVKVMDQIKD